jgi:hypothetical protein
VDRRSSVPKSAAAGAAEKIPAGTIRRAATPYAARHFDAIENNRSPEFDNYC